MGESDNDEPVEPIENDETRQNSEIIKPPKKKQKQDMKSMPMIGGIPKNFQCKTPKCKKLCTMISSINDTNAEGIKFEFTEIGMFLYSNAMSHTGVVVKAFWHSSFFEDYKCEQCFSIWVSVKDILDVTKKIKDIDMIIISTFVEKSFEGLRFSGNRKQESKNETPFNINVAHITQECDDLDFSTVQWVLDINTPSSDFSKSIQFIKGPEESYVQIKCDQKLICFSSVGENGAIKTETFQKAHVAKEICGQTFENIFSHKSLRAVTTAHELNQMLHIVHPLVSPIVLFAYILDESHQPNSHFSLYVPQKIVEDC